MHTNESKEKKEKTEQEERKQEAQIGSNCRTRIGQILPQSKGQRWN